MCLSVFLLADRSLSIPPAEETYPGLRLYPVEEQYQAETLAGIRRVKPTACAYQVSPAGYCGCYFGYESAEEFANQMAERAANPETQYANTPEQAETMWRSRTAAVQSLGRFLADHAAADLAVYAVWENCAGQKDLVRATVPPTYFAGPGFEPLPEDVLLRIAPVSTEDAEPAWDPAAPRTHAWLGCGDACGMDYSEEESDESQRPME